jgi:hypothetical protein
LVPAVVKARVNSSPLLVLVVRERARVLEEGLRGEGLVSMKDLRWVDDMILYLLPIEPVKAKKHKM